MYRLLVILHLLGASIWIGAHLIVSTLVLPRALRARDPAVILDFEARFERLGRPALLVQVVTGLWLAYIRVPGIGRWFSPDSPVSALIAAKLALLVIMLAIAAHARLRVIPRVRPDTLHVLAWHIVAVTIVSVAFLIVGVGIRTGGLF